MRPNCPKCSKDRPVKNGQALGKRRWKCRFCHYEFTQNFVSSTPDVIKVQAVLLYDSGWSSNSVAELLQVSPSSVLRWARQKTGPNGRVHQLKPRIYLPPELKKGIKSIRALISDL